jgi:ribosomal protein S18 acetylase RimI-like enzyme
VGAVDDPVRRAIDHVARLATGEPLDRTTPVDLHFQPDLMVDGATTLASILNDGRYRSQFETGTSNGGLTAHDGGDRWRWESRMFGAAYDGRDAGLRPKYGSLNYLRDPYGGSPRFGSAYFEVAPSALDRVTFCFPDSVFAPTDFGTFERMALVPLVETCGFADPLDVVIEAHLHGRVDVAADVRTLVLDPSYRGTQIEVIARRLPCRLQWHSGYRANVDVLTEHPAYRGPEIVDAAVEIAVDGMLTPHIIGTARAAGRFDLQTVKRVWHCLARFGRRDPALLLGDDDPVAIDVLHLRNAHHAFAREVTPAGHVHAIDPAAAPDPTVAFHSARGARGRLLAIGALRTLDDGHGELKSMHTAASARGAGVGRAMLDHLIAEARAAGMEQVSLETGTMDAFVAARALYRSAGFVECAPFGEYADNPFSVCMTIRL